MPGWRQQAMDIETEASVTVHLMILTAHGKCVGWQVRAVEFGTERLLAMEFAPRLESTSGTNVQEGLAAAQTLAEEFLSPF
jgi:hypothetical protein